MLSFGALAFLNPWLLAGLGLLPILWWLLRAIPPSPKTQVFAGVRLLLGLEDEERQTDRTPWWLLLLRCLAIGAAILGFANPVSNLVARVGDGNGTLLVLHDQGWASAPDWAEHMATARAILDDAADQGRDVLLWDTTDAQPPPLMSASAALDLLAGMRPKTWEPDHETVLARLGDGTLDMDETIWLQDGLARGGTEDLMAELARRGPLRVIGPGVPAFALTPPRLEEGELKADVVGASDPAGLGVVVFARAEAGGERRIAVSSAGEAVNGRAEVVFDLPSELYGSVTRIALADRASAGGAAFADGSIRRVPTALVSAGSDTAVTTLTSPTHYLEKALLPWASLSMSTLTEAIEADPAVIVLADYGVFSDADRAALLEWTEAGGLLVRFSGPRLAAAIGTETLGTGVAEDTLLPMRLRRGGRVLGGALAWSTPRALGPFGDLSPFRGLTPPEEVDVRTQVLAEPSPDLADRVWATLDDGTPLVTAAPVGRGRVVLFHVSSDAEWSSLPLSGLFVEMLGRIVALAPGRAAGLPSADQLDNTIWRAESLMGANGAPILPTALEGTISGERILAGVGPDLPPGVYVRAGTAEARAGEVSSVVVNLTDDETTLRPFPDAPAGVVVETLGGTAPVRHGPWLIALAALLVIADIIGTLFVSGRLGARTAAAPLLVMLAVLVHPSPPQAQTQDDDAPDLAAIAAAAETTLGFVRTGNTRIDQVSERAMAGLGMALTERTAVEPGPPVGVRPGVDELSFYPVIYWPLLQSSLPDRAALDALSSYLRGGGMLIIDTQNGASGFGGASAAEMREIARALNLPPLAPVDDDHVLSRTFYLLNQFPGRWRGGRIWAEAPPPGIDGSGSNPDIPQFDRVDDNVSPVIVGSADWASAWAVDDRGYPLYPVGRPGDRQRELALRFGVNAVMYALTGNYKSDQVHAPAVLQRLGQ